MYSAPDLHPTTKQPPVFLGHSITGLLRRLVLRRSRPKEPIFYFQANKEWDQAKVAYRTNDIPRRGLEEVEPEDLKYSG
ncbi:unnamed protein product [Nezara viridula]|uniref:Uncharacterized protein n=1 Tax=Nezara viridula TaxID=85310 RepID=A0A9P0MN73_NEZVI|nr:unnamed protein product [Nezara viridula]